MAQAVSRRPLSVAAWVRAQVNPVGFVVDEVALGLVFLSSSVFPCQYHSTVGSNFPKIVLSFIRPFTHPHPGTDGQKARKSGRSPVRRESHPP
jgi:hypothetical protein